MNDHVKNTKASMDDVARKLESAARALGRKVQA